MIMASWVDIVIDDYVKMRLCFCYWQCHWDERILMLRVILKWNVVGAEIHCDDVCFVCSWRGALTLSDVPGGEK